MLHDLDELWVILARLVLLQAILEARCQIAGIQEKEFRELKFAGRSSEHDRIGPIPAQKEN